MSEASPVRDLIDSWPSLSAFAQDAGVTYGAAKQMRRRKSIPGDLWFGIAASESAKGLGITIERLAEVHARVAEPAPC